MNEYLIGWTAIGSLMGLSLATGLYMMGGRNNKAIRRFGASAIMTVVVCVSSKVMGCFSWWMLVLYPLLCLQFIQGYSNNEGKGWIKRLGISMTAVLAGVTLAIILQGHSWALIFPHAWVASVTTMFSFKNPIMAAAEEPLVCFLNNFFLIFYIFVI